MVFLGSDGASVNSIKNSGLIKLFQEELPWSSFIWCFSHRLELALKDALNEFMEPVEKSLMHLFYLYKKSSKKHRELKNLYELLQGQFEMFSAGVRPLKSSGTRWIDHKIGAMGRLIEKVGLYTQHLQNAIATSGSAKDKSTSEGKFKKLIDAKVLLRSALFKDILADAKVFSLLTQKHTIDIIKIIDSVESTKNNYERLRKKLEKIPEYVFELPTLKMVIDEIESNTEDGEPIYQNQNVQYYSREKMFVKNHCAEIVDAIINCYEKRYGNLFESELNSTINANSDQGDAILLEVCRVLNCNLWAINQMELNDDDPRETYSVECGALLRIFERYKQMKSFDGYDEDDVSHSVLSIIRHALRYFDVHKIEPVEFWSTIRSLTKEHADWKPTTLLIEICLCAPFSNAILERFFR